MDCSAALLSFQTIKKLLMLQQEQEQEQEQIIENIDNYNENVSHSSAAPNSSAILLHCNYYNPSPSDDDKRHMDGGNNTLAYTILEIQSVSSIFDMSSATNDRNDTSNKMKKDEDEGVEEIIIHPILSEILTLCSSIKINNNQSANNEDNEMDAESNSIDHNNTNHYHRSIPVSLKCNTNDNNDKISYNIYPIKELKKDYLYDDNATTKLEICVDYWFVDNNDSNNGSNMNNIIELLSISLEGRIISKGCIILVTLPTECCYNECDYGHVNTNNDDDSYVIIKINHVFLIDNHKDDSFNDNHNIDIIECCYRLGLSNSFNLILSSSSSSSTLGSQNNNNNNETEIVSSDTDAHKISTEEEDNINKSEISSIGYCYESEYNELYKLSILSLNNNISSRSTSISSAILITGTSGIGKSHLVELLLHKINNKYDNNVIIHNISCNDILLAASSSSYATTYNTSAEDELINNIILPFDIITSSTKENIKIVLVIDDLNILYSTNNNDNASSSNDDIDSNIAKNAINESIKLLQKHEYNNMIIGIYKTPRKTNVPKDLYAINKFEYVVHLNVPTQYQRELLLYDILLSSYNNDNNDRSVIQYYSKVIATHTSGYIACDLKRICINAYINTTFFQNDNHNNNDIIPYFQKKIKETTTKSSKNSIALTLNDLLQSIQKYKPNQLSTIDVISPKQQLLTLKSSANPDNLLNNDELLFYNNCNNMNFGGYDMLKKRIYRSVIQPWKRYLSYQYKQQKQSSSSSSSSSSSLMQQQSPPKGMILSGSSGTGKTNLAHIISTTLKFQLLQIKQTNILNKWLGSSEENIRNIFLNANNCSPCVVLFDDIDSFTSSRNDYDGGGGDDVYSRILSTLLNEMDGISHDNNRNVFIIATTNRLNAVDSALLRPGRIEEHVCISKPNVDDTLDIMLMHTKQMNLHDNVNLKDIVSYIHCGYEKGISCADIEGVCREACFSAMRRLELMDDDDVTNERHCVDEDDEVLLVENIDFQDAVHTMLSL